MQSVHSVTGCDTGCDTLVTIAKDMADTESESWAKAVGHAVAAYNSNSHPALMNSAPEDGSLTLQGAGTKLRGIPGFAEAMTEQNITGIGAFHK